MVWRRPSGFLLWTGWALGECSWQFTDKSWSIRRAILSASVGAALLRTWSLLVPAVQGATSCTRIDCST